jgi:hypothetical protein
MSLRFITCVLAASMAVSEVAAATAPKLRQKDSDGRLHLFREKVEIYWNDWSGVRVSGRKGGQVDVHVRAEGKTEDSDGTLSINCQSGSGYSWRTAASFGKPLSEGDINRAVPIQVVANAKKLFC